MKWLRHNWGWPVVAIALALLVFWTEIYDGIEALVNPEDKEQECQDVLDGWLEEHGGFYDSEHGEEGPWTARGALEVWGCEGTAAWDKVHIEICRAIRTLDDEWRPYFDRRSSDDVRYMLDREGCN